MKRKTNHKVFLSFMKSREYFVTATILSTLDYFFSLSVKNEFKGDVRKQLGGVVILMVKILNTFEIDSTKNF